MVQIYLNIYIILNYVTCIPPKQHAPISMFNTKETMKNGSFIDTVIHRPYLYMLYAILS